MLEEKQYRIWGNAKGTRSTEGAARGAFTCREYPQSKLVSGKRDWIYIISIELVK